MSVDREPRSAEKFQFPGHTRRVLKVVDRIPGESLLWEVSPHYRFTAGTNFSRDRQSGETINRRVTGRLTTIMDGPSHMYLMADDLSGTPAVCLISNAPIPNIAQLKKQLLEAAEKDAIPFIQDKESGLLIIPTSGSVKEKVGEEIHVGPYSDNHRNLLIFPFLIRDLLRKKNIFNRRSNLLTNEDFDYNITDRFRYGDILRTRDGTLVTTVLAKHYPPNVRTVLDSLDLAPYDNLPTTDNVPAVHQWFHMLQTILNLKSPAELVKKYMAETGVLDQYRFDEFMSSYWNNLVRITPGLLDTESVDREGRILTINDPSKEEILEAVADGYDPSTGLESKAVILYRHPQRNSFLLVIGGSHPEIEDYVKKLAQGYSEPIEIAQLAGAVFFDKPEEVIKGTFMHPAIPQLQMSAVLNKLQNTPHVDTDIREVRKALEFFKKNPLRYKIKITIADSLNEQLVVQKKS